LEEAWYRWTPFSSTSSINNHDDASKMDVDIENSDNNASINDIRPIFIEITPNTDTNENNKNKFKFNIKKMKEVKRKAIIMSNDDDIQ
jgi:hypothetical protein